MKEYEGRFYPSALMAQLPFSNTVSDAASKLLSGDYAYLPGITEAALNTSATLAHEMTHYLQYTSHPACVAVVLLEHQVYGLKLGILGKFGTRYYAKEVKSLHTREEIFDPELYAEYMILSHSEAVLELLTDFGRWPLKKISEFNRATRRPPQLISLKRNAAQDDFLPTVRMPSEEEIDDVISMPTLEEMAESLAMMEELSYIGRCCWRDPEHLYPEFFRIRAEYLRNPHYSRAFLLAMKGSGCELQSALPIAILSLALSGPCVFCNTDGVLWNEFSPQSRLKLMLGLADQLPKSVKAVDMSNANLNEAFHDIDQFFSKKVGWRSAHDNTVEALRYVRDVRVRHAGQLNTILLSRVEQNMAARLEAPAFPQRLEKPQRSLAPPVLLFDDQITTSVNSEDERQDIVAYLRIVAMQFSARHLIDRKDDNTTEADFARRLYSFVRAYVLSNVAPEFLEIARQRTPEGYDDFLATFVAS